MIFTNNKCFVQLYFESFHFCGAIFWQELTGKTRDPFCSLICWEIFVVFSW